MYMCVINIIYLISKSLRNIYVCEGYDMDVHLKYL